MRKRRKRCSLCMTSLACVLGLSASAPLAAADVAGDTQIVVGRDQGTSGDTGTGDGQLRRTFAGTMPRTGDAATHASALALTGAAAITLARIRDGPHEGHRRDQKR